MHFHFAEHSEGRLAVRNLDGENEAPEQRHLCHLNEQKVPQPLAHPGTRIPVHLEGHRERGRECGHKYLKKTWITDHADRWDAPFDFFVVLLVYN